MRNVRRTLLGLMLVLVCLGMAGCAGDKGSREYQPGKGWVPA
jgi:hypothetical protein